MFTEFTAAFNIFYIVINIFWKSYKRICDYLSKVCILIKNFCSFFENSANYSFTVSMAVMAGVMVKSLISSSSREYIAANWQLLTLANVVAFVSGLAAIYFVMKFLEKKKSLQAFGWYRVVLATIIIIFELLK